MSWRLALVPHSQKVVGSIPCPFPSVDPCVKTEPMSHLGPTCVILFTFLSEFIRLKSCADTFLSRIIKPKQPQFDVIALISAY